MDLLSINWLWRFIFLLVPASLLWGAELTRIFIGFYTGKFTSWDFVDLTWGILTIFIYVVSYMAFRQKDLFEDAIAPIQLSDSSLVTEGESDSVLEAKLTQAMVQDQLYLQPDLTIHDVARAVNVSTRKASNCINRCFDANFSEWVNKYRISEVKEKFVDGGSQHYTIEAIGQEAGFKSRSAMYAAFNKFTAHFRNIQPSQSQAS
jgi:AraC-like DNA-binding protein